MQRVRQAAVRAADDRPGPPVALTARAGLLALLLVTACGGSDEPAPPSSVVGSSTVESGAPCVPAVPLDAASVPPPPVPLPARAVLTDVTQAGPVRLVTGRVEASVDAVLEHFRGAPGYVVTRDEDEGRAGELQLFGPSGDVTVTVARLTCPRGSTSFTVSTAVTQVSPPGQQD